MKTRFLSLSLLFLSLTAGAKNVVWFDGHKPVSYSVNAHRSTVVDKALDMFSSDMKAVTGHHADRKGNGRIAIYQLDRLDDKEFAELHATGVPYNKIITKPDAFYITVSKGRIIVVGSNGRGTAYGILELSRQAGVSPWTWWGDVRPVRRHTLIMSDKFVTMQWPSVSYRGVFINDEDWTNRVWAHERMDTRLKKGAMGPHYYHQLFELLLRLRANAVWPAMHNGTVPFFMVKGNKEVADSFDIYVGSSHCEPILRNNVGEWDESLRGPYNFITNRKNVEAYWRERARETSSMDALYTLGMRGIHDGSMAGVKTMSEKVKALQEVINSQRHMLQQEVSKDLTKVPQVFIPYKEVLDIYTHGLKVPDDVTLMWCDDNYGYLTRLPDVKEQKRSGGGGIYYHLSYWGRPHDWLWQCSMQPGLLYSEMRAAYDSNCRRMWIANVHDPKTAAYPLTLFLDMAWNINCVKPNTIKNHLLNWLVQQFGTEAGQRTLQVMTEYYRLTAIRKPEFMGFNQVELNKKIYSRGWSPVQDTEFSAGEFGNELERYLNDYENIRAKADDIARSLRPELRDAYFAAVQYPVATACDMAVKQLQAQESRHIGRKETFHHDREAMQAAARSLRAYDDIIKLTDYYNNEMAGGKWKGNMSSAPRGLYVFGAPSLPDALTDKERAEFADYGAQPATLDNDGCVVRNACQWSRHSGRVTPVQMLGHSMNAVAIERGSELSFDFNTTRDSDSAVVRIAMIPTQPSGSGDLRFQVTLDDSVKAVYSLKESFRSEGWKQNVLRGQALRFLPVVVKKGAHTLSIKALDSHIIADQWMIDYDLDREFYIFPVQASE